MIPKIPKTELYLVGGSVRDKLLGKVSKDRDYVAITKLNFNNLVEEIKKVGVVFQAKPEFLTIRCRIDKETIDIALPRVEKTYRDNRHPDSVKRVKTLKEDASRRDFTINAMYMDKKGKVIDYFGGKKDLQKGVIRTVGNAEKRFEEDYLRILRMVRFAAQLDFGICAPTYQAAFLAVEKLRKVEPNRVREELNKALLANPKIALYYINEFNLWDIMKEMGIKIQLTARMI